MKRILAYLCQSRWCRMLGIGVLLCALLLLHPFVRQSLIGPTIEGIPWCEWEEDFRHSARPLGARPSWFRTKLQDLGLIEPRGGLRPGSPSAMAPLYISLANDEDVHVRRSALLHLSELSNRLDADIVPVLRGRLHDRDPECRLTAASSLWLKTADPKLTEVVQGLVKSPDRDVRMAAISLAGEMGAASPELFSVLMPLAEDSDYAVRCLAINSMGSFGSRGVPVIRQGMGDRNAHVREAAIFTASRMPKHRDALIPLVLELRNDPNPQVREAVADVLPIMDAKRFPKQP